MIKIFNNFRILRKFTIKITENFYPANLDHLLERLSPDLVITTGLGTFSFDEFIMRAAKKKG